MKAIQNRLRLADMSDLEFTQWQTASKIGLQRAIKRMDTYLSGRSKHGIRTGTDSAMEDDLALLRDLLAVLSELDELRACVVGPCSHSGQTGMLLLYDTHDGKLRP